MSEFIVPIVIAYLLSGALLSVFLFLHLGVECFVAGIFMWPLAIAGCLLIAAYKLLRIVCRGCMGLIREAINVLQEK